MNVYWLIRNQIDYRWIVPYVVKLSSSLSIDTVYLDISALGVPSNEIQPDFLSNTPVKVVYLNSKIQSNFFSEHLIRIAIFEWGTGLPLGLLKFLRHFTRFTPEEKYRAKVLSFIKKRDQVVKIALPHGFNVKTNLVTQVGIKAKLVAPLKLAKDRNFFDIYGYDTEFHKDRLIKSGILKSRLMKLPPLFALQSTYSDAPSRRVGSLLIFPKLTNKVSSEKLVSFIRLIEGNDLFISLHPRQKAAQLDFLDFHRISFNNELIELGHNPALILSKFSNVYDVGSSVALFAAFAGCDYFLLKCATSNQTIFELGAFDSDEPAMLLSNELLKSYISFFHNQVKVKRELEHFIETVKGRI